MEKDKDRRLVYSTDRGGQIPQNERRVRPAATKGQVPDDGTVRVFRERRRGSSMTIVTGLSDVELRAVGADLRCRCATGGTAKNGVVELQGDHRDAVLAYFERAGRRAKKAGG